MSTQLPVRARLAVAATRGVAAVSRATGRGDGSVIGGRVGLGIDPRLLRRLAAGRQVALVSGTNGKTTTTRLTAAAIGVLGQVASNPFGANLPNGHVSALALAPHTSYAALEVDEHYLPHACDAARPRVIAMLNLTRDQLDRAMEVAMIARLWRDTVRGRHLHVVANADDPLVVWAADAAEEVSWVAAGQRWHDDSEVCPECGSAIERVPHANGTAIHWRCTGCALARPNPQWTLDDEAVIDPDGNRHDVKLSLPGRVNRANAMMALAVAARFGVRPNEALPRLAEVTSVAGRYAVVERDGKAIRLLLAKNPAGWLEAFDMAEQAPTLLCINARDPDGLDTSWLFDVDFAPLRGCRVLISGERAYDLGVRLAVNDIDFVHVRSFTDALATMPDGRAEVIANYTAFQQIRAELNRVD
ncbi:MurT ligase domain-containing protein [Actinopolymorpha singaporensis]|uniref:Lipid II isoglutaminyl synthase (glutamine-hydrolyzing) subunit MurT n=1 Tax=Actinopolymorpha singaporensis TaxID=117157 RepID=A0A1H1S3M8_9ACTN|nr:MurT ligase domain-containing protein [Actinopolymorpha singaporensis]SDS42607.1 UDP-N-acetylmuramyl tripeptide synthase [Actinopolymorpha singaporensis]